MNITFRKCTDKDFEYVYELREKGFRWYLEDILNGWDENAHKDIIRHEMAEHLEDMNIIVYKGNDAGLFTYYKDENNSVFIDMIVLEPEYRGMGIGASLLQFLIDAYPGVRLYLRTYEKNPARKLYNKFGFKVYDTETNYVWMELV